MLDNVLNLIKSTVSEVVSNNQAVPDDKKDQIVQTTTHALSEGLQQHLSLDNLSNLKDLFSEGPSGAGGNAMVQSLESTVTNALTQKVGLSQSMSNNISTTIVQAVVNVFTSKINDPNEKGFNLESLIGLFTGGDGNNGGILGKIGKLFS